MICALPCAVLAQEAEAIIFGKVTNEKGKALAEVNVAVLNQVGGVATNDKGYYELPIPANELINIAFSFIGYETIQKPVKLKAGDKMELDVTLKSDSKRLKEFEVSGGERNKAASVTKIEAKVIERLPTATGSLESILPTLPGVTSNNELSSQYSVRGGNFDENLVYVNDFEIFRPFLIRSGQQEGMSFINPDLVSSISFSAGGFEARYGDKLSSVLDVDYRKPTEFAATISAGLLGVNGHLEGTLGKKQRLSYLMGTRYRTSKYLLNSLQTKGSYAPSFTDFQGLITYRLSDNWELQGIGNFARNSFFFEPTDRETSFGSFNQALQLNVNLFGQENDSYQTYMGGLAMVYLSNNKKLTLKLLGSTYSNREVEAYDLIGGYAIGEVENNLGNEDFGELTSILGSGLYHDFARNTLTANIQNIAHRGYWDKRNHRLSWGLKYQKEVIEDQLNQWYRTDSAGYNVPLNNPNLEFEESLKTTIDLNSNRFSGFIQDDWAMGVEERLNLSAGVRFNYWDLNEELLISPRFQLSFQPKITTDTAILNKGGVERSLIFRLAAGAYYQPPFYREMRDLEGNVNTDLKAQKSAHIVVGSEYTFNMLGGRPFKLTTELYYKQLWDLVPYDYDNLLIRYQGQNRAKGYAAGLDLRLFGQFVQGTDSWISLSIMRTQEDLEGDVYYDYFDENGEEITYNNPGVPVDSTLIEQGYVARPTDQRVTFGMFFQDYFPNNENFKMHLMLLMGTGLPYTPINASPEWRNKSRIPVYRRVDIGFSSLLFDREKRELASRSPLRGFKSIWATLEVFNLLNISNTVSFTWIKALSSDYRTEVLYPVPNKLTARRVNFRLVAKF